MKLRWLPRPDATGYSLQVDGVIIGWIKRKKPGLAWNVRVIGVPKISRTARTKDQAARIILNIWRNTSCPPHPSPSSTTPK